MLGRGCVTEEEQDRVALVQSTGGGAASDEPVEVSAATVETVMVYRDRERVCVQWLAMSRS